MQVTTGYGYYVKDNLKFKKYELPIGRHPDPRPGITFVEVESKKDLDAIKLDKCPIDPEIRRIQIDVQLEKIDWAKIRIMSDYLLKKTIMIDGILKDPLEYLAELEAIQEPLRKEFTALGGYWRTGHWRNMGKDSLCK